MSKGSAWLHEVKSSPSSCNTDNAHGFQASQNVMQLRIHWLWEIHQPLHFIEDPQLAHLSLPSGSSLLCSSINRNGAIRKAPPLPVPRLVSAAAGIPAIPVRGIPVVPGWRRRASIPPGSQVIIPVIPLVHASALAPISQAWSRTHDERRSQRV